MLTPLDPTLRLILQFAGFALMLSLAAVGGALLARGWRGRVLSWAPSCARCGFDLRPRSADLPADCPECGRVLAGAVIPGPRSMAPGRMAAGAAFLLLSTATAAGLLFRAPVTVNEWILSWRPLSSFDASLDANDARAWRFLSEKARLGRMEPEEMSRFLDRVLARAAKAGQWSPSDESVIGAIAQAANHPTGLEERVLEATLALPNPMRVRAVGEGARAGRPFSVSLELGRVPQIVRMPIEARIVSVALADGRELELFAPTTQARWADWRSPISMALYKAPDAPGDYDAMASIEIRRSVDEPPPASVRPGDAELPQAPDGTAVEPLDQSANPAGMTSENGRSGPLLKRLLIPLSITVKPASSAP